MKEGADGGVNGVTEDLQSVGMGPPAAMLGVNVPDNPNITEER